MKQLVIAHRGASFYRPENTLAAFELAYEQGADGIETDLHLSKDRIPVLIHDETIDRVSNKKGYVNQYTYQELKQLDIGSWFDGNYQNERILSLAEFLQWNKQKKLFLNLELKTSQIAYPMIEKTVYHLLIKHGMLDQTVISSFNLDSLKNFRKINSTVKLARIASKYSAKLLTTSTTNRFDGIHLNHKSSNANIAKQVHAKHMYLGLYTVNEPAEMISAFQSGCDMLITDRPGLAIEQRQLAIDQAKQ